MGIAEKVRCDPLKKSIPLPLDQWAGLGGGNRFSLLLKLSFCRRWGGVSFKEVRYQAAKSAFLQGKHEQERKPLSLEQMLERG